MQLSLTQSLKNKTRNIRLETALNIMEILSPSTAKWVNQVVKYAHEVPRPFTLMLKATGKKGLVGAEIGFGNGTNAANLLKELPLKKLYCIDPYIAQSYTQGEMEIESYRTKEALERYWNLLSNEYISFIQHPSSEATRHFKPQELDFVYIDGNHTYQYVKQDLELYTPLVKKGGYIGGHDYIFGQSGVIKAVQEHAIKIGKPPTINFPDFWFQV